MKQRRRLKVRTLRQASSFSPSARACSFADSKNGLPTLWDATDLSDKKPIGGWSPRIIAVWNWKNELPAKFPDKSSTGNSPAASPCS